MKTKNSKIIYVVFALFAAAVMLFFVAFASGCGKEDDNYGSQAGSGLITGDDVDNSNITENETTDNGEGNTEEDNEGETEEPAIPEGLTISLADVVTTPRFFGTTVDGTYFEVIALKVNGEYRTAFNTCRNCYGSRNAYYKLVSGNLQCQNCKFTFTYSQVGTGGTSSSNCGPFPISASNRVITNTDIIITNTYLIQCKALFKSWGGQQQ